MKQSHFTLIALVLIAGGFILAAFFYKAEQGEQASQQIAQHSDTLIRDHSVRVATPKPKSPSSNSWTRLARPAPNSTPWSKSCSNGRTAK